MLLFSLLFPSYMSLPQHIFVKAYQCSRIASPCARVILWHILLDIFSPEKAILPWSPPAMGYFSLSCRADEVRGLVSFRILIVKITAIPSYYLALAE